MAKLTITSMFGGENTTIEGTISVNGVDHSISASGSASDRGTHATVDGRTFWWWGSDMNTENPEIEEAADEAFSEAYEKARELGIEDDHWVAVIEGGEITVTEVQDEED